MAKLKYRVAFFLGLLSLCISMTYSFVSDHVIYKDFWLFYSYTDNTNSNRIGYEITKMNIYNFDEEKIIFTVIENILTGPQNVYLEPNFERPLSLHRVHLFNDLLVIDFNQELLKLSKGKELLLIQLLAYAVKKNFPFIKAMIWLTDGRKLTYIKTVNNYQYPILIENSIDMEEYSRSLQLMGSSP